MERKNVVIILGAGFSKAVCSDMPLVKELSDLVCKEFEKRNWTLPDAYGKFENFENYLTYLAESAPWLNDYENYENKATFQRITLAIANIIKTKQRSAIGKPLPLALQRLANLNLSQELFPTIISLNYDNLLEGAFLANGTVVSQSLRFIYKIPLTPVDPGRYLRCENPGVRAFDLLKLHGSINWYWSGFESTANDPIFDAGLAKSQWGNQSFNSDTKWNIEYTIGGKVPCIIPPISVKEHYFLNTALRYQWRLARDAISQAHQVHIVGYSIPLTDLPVIALLRLNMDSNRVRVIPVNRDSDYGNHMKLIFGVDNYDKRYIGRDNVVEEWADKLNQLIKD